MLYFTYYVELPVQPTKSSWWPRPLTFWPWKWCPRHVWRGLYTSVSICLRPRVRLDVRDRQSSDVRQKHRL